MSGQIFQPNFTDVGGSADIQGAWQLQQEACYRPSVDLKLPIICAAYEASYSVPENNVNREYYGEDLIDQFRTYASCCPDNTDSRNRTSIYTLTEQCPFVACFTSDETAAANFDVCVQTQARKAEQRLRNNGTVPANATRTVGGTGRCEYIDFEALKKGVKSESQARVVTSTQGVLFVVFFMLLATSGTI